MEAALSGGDLDIFISYYGDVFRPDSALLEPLPGVTRYSQMLHTQRSRLSGGHASLGAPAVHGPNWQLFWVCGDSALNPLISP
jgi:hypothetical protein